MIVFDQDQIRDLLPWPVLIDALRKVFAAGIGAPVRHHYEIPVPGAPAGTLLLMPAWQAGRFLGVKIVNVFPGNAARGKDAVSGLYVLADATTGNFLAHIDGSELTARRTAAASALAASFLARRDAHTLLVVGTGRVSWNLAQAYCAIRPIGRVLVHGRNPEKTRRFAGGLAFLPACVEPAADLAAALAVADIVTVATLSPTPLIHGRDLREGMHIDLVGGFRPDMREADDDVIRRTGRVYVDTRAGAFKEAGDIVRPMASGVLAAEAVVGDLFDLCAGRCGGRQRDADITLFKSVGAAIEDLAAAAALYERHVGAPSGGMADAVAVAGAQP